MIKQFTDKEYERLAERALMLAETPVPPPTNYNESPATTCKSVHKLLAVDGRKVKDLTPYEQMIAGVFMNMKLATVPEFMQGNIPTGTLFPAVEVGD
jgi:hypothetical protein